MQHNFFKIHLSTLYKNMKALIAISIANYSTQQSVSHHFAIPMKLFTSIRTVYIADWPFQNETSDNIFYGALD